MQVHDPPGTGLLVQAVDILGHEQGHAAERLELGQRAVRRIGPRSADVGPAVHAAGPVATSHLGTLDELLVLDRIAALPFAMVIPVGRDTGRGGDAGARDHHPARVGAQRLDKAVEHGAIIGASRLPAVNRFTASCRPCQFPVPTFVTRTGGALFPPLELDERTPH